LSPIFRSGAESTRQLVIDGAIKKFSEKSFLRATTMDIAQEAGVSEKTIFDLFGDKKTLYLEVREYIRRSAIRDMLIRLPIGGGAPVILRALGREFLRNVAGARDRARVSIQAITAIDDGDIKRTTREYFQETQSLVRSIVTEGQKSDLVRQDLNVEAFAWTYAMALHSVGFISLMELAPKLDEQTALLFLNRLVDTIEPV
jgi:AcrR family transcriptional regulator